MFTNFFLLRIRSHIEYDITKNIYEYIISRDIKKSLTLLTRNIDEEGKKLINLILDRHNYIYKHNLILSKYTNSEYLDQDISLKKYFKKFPNFDKYLFETFYSHNGLKYVSDGAIKKIENTDVIDCGAFIGDSALIFSKEYNFRHIYSFEPEKDNYESLKRNIKKFNMSNVKAIKMGINSKTDNLYMNGEREGSKISTSGENLIRMTSIDRFVKNNNICPGLIKMDIEGMEYDAVIGATSSIVKYRPVMLISIYHTGKDFFEIKPYVEKISNDGYLFKVKKTTPFDLIREVMLICIPKNTK